MDKDVTIKMIVFTLAGIASAFLAGVIVYGLGINTYSAGFTLMFLLAIIPLYMGFLVFLGYLFGKFEFFYFGQKKIAERSLQFIKKQIFNNPAESD